MTLQKCVSVSCTFYFSGNKRRDFWLYAKTSANREKSTPFFSSVMRTSRVLVLLRDIDVNQLLAWCKHVDLLQKEKSVSLISCRKK